MKKSCFVLITAVLVCSFVLGLSMPLYAKPVQLKLVSFFQENSIDAEGIKILIEKMNEKFKNDLQIKWIGGPEVIPMFQQHEAVRKGVIDMCVTSSTFYPNYVFEAKSIMFTDKSYMEILDTEYFDILRPLHEKAGFIYLGSTLMPGPIHIFTNFEIAKLEDFVGKKIRVFPAYIPFMKALGAIPINMPIGDIYTAMERGVVDGFVQSHNGFVEDFSWHEVTKYAVDYVVYYGSTVLLVNPKAWSKLPQNVQDEIWAYKKKVIDPLIMDYYTNIGASKWKLLKDKGVKPLKLESPADEEKFHQLLMDSAWKEIEAKSTELGPKLKKILLK